MTEKHRRAIAYRNHDHGTATHLVARLSHNDLQVTDTHKQMRRIVLKETFMKTLILSTALVMSIASSAFALEPIKGSITYGGQPATRLSAAPIGSPVTHQFTDEFGRDVEETYIITKDRTLKLVNRRTISIP